MEVSLLLILLLVFILIPALELSVLIRVGEVLGTFNTIALCIFTALVGASLVRSQGVSTLMQAQKKLAQGELPQSEIIQGMMLAMAGVLLVIPGFVTDFIGILLLTPVTRAPIAAFMLKRMQIKMANSASFKQGPFNQNPFSQNPFNQEPSSHQQGNTFDGDYEHKVDPLEQAHRLNEKDDIDKPKQ